MSDHERQCIVAPSHTYEYCPHCDKSKDRETWRALYCSENCRSIFNVCSQYVAKKITASEAKRQLNGLKLPAMNELADSISKNVQEIMGSKEDVKPVSSASVVEKQTDENNVQVVEKPSEAKVDAKTDVEAEKTEDKSNIVINNTHNDFSKNKNRRQQIVNEN